MGIIPNHEFYVDPVFFACDQYSDDVINYFLYTAWDKSFSRTMHRQREFANTMARTIPLTSFTVDVKLNSKLKIPARSLTYRADGFHLPITDKKRFVKLYGNFNKPIAMKTMMQDGKTFAFSMDCSIGNYGFLDLYFYPTLYNYTYLVLIPTFVATTVTSEDENEIYETFDTTNPRAAGSITNEQITNLQALGAKLTVQWTRHGNVYRIAGRVSNYVNVDAKHIQLPIDRSKFASFMMRDIDRNSWDLYITDNNQSGQYLYARAVSSVIDVNENMITFELPSEGFGQRVNQVIVGSIYAIHRPTRQSCLIYKHDTGLAPIFQLKDLVNPVNPVNYLISLYDSGTTRKLQTEILQTEPRYFPNIIDLTSTTWAGNDLMIEAFEIPVRDSACCFENPAGNYMESVGDAYASVVTDLDLCPNAIANYSTSLAPNADAYPWDTSSFKRNIRGYFLNMLNDICQDNPMMYKHLQIFLDDLNKRFTTRSGTPDSLKFTREYVMSNYDLAVVQKDDTTHFEEQHGMFRMTTTQEDAPALLYLNGRLQKVTLFYPKTGFEYMYFPKRLVDEGMTRYADKAEINRAKPITIDAFPSYSRRGDNLHQILRWSSPDDLKTLFENSNARDGVSIDDLVFYNNISNEYIPKESFKFIVLVNEYVYSHERGDEVVLLDKAHSTEYMLTSLGELYQTMNFQEIILRDAKHPVDLDSFTSWQQDGINAISNKELPLGTIQVGIKDVTLLGQDIVCAPVNRYEEREFSGASLIPNNYILEYKQFNFPRDIRRVEVYLDGELIYPDMYTVQFPDAYNGTMKIDLSLIQEKISPLVTVTVVLLPKPFVWKQYELTDGRLKENNFVTNAYSEIRNDFTGAPSGLVMYQLDPDRDAKYSELLDFKNARVFLNGMRFAYEDRDDIHLTNMMYFDDDAIVRASKLDKPIQQWNGVRVLIKYPARDVDMYRMNRLMMKNMQQSIIDGK